MKLYRVENFPVDLAIPLDHLLQAKASCEPTTYAFVGNPDGLRLGLGQRTRSSTFDLEHLKADGVYVEKRPYGGSGFFCGPEDVYFSVHVNRTGLENPDQSVNDVFHVWHTKLCETLRELGVDAHIQDTSTRKNVNDGVCMNLSGRSEIVDSEGNKLVAGVFKDDGLVISMSGVILISPAWLKIYDYLLNGPPRPMKGVCLQTLLPDENLTERVIDLLCGTLDNAESMTLHDHEWDMLRQLVKKFRVM